MQTSFEQLNIHVYYTGVGVFLSFVIWCLGPLVNDQRDYGTGRLYLAAVTRKLCRVWLRRHGVIPETD